MITKQSLEQQLETTEFYKKVYPGMLKSGKRKDALETWKHAITKGVSDSVLLKEHFTNHLSIKYMHFLSMMGFQKIWLSN